MSSSSSSSVSVPKKNYQQQSIQHEQQNNDNDDQEVRKQCDDDDDNHQHHHHHHCRRQLPVEVISLPVVDKKKIATTSSSNSSSSGGGDQQQHLHNKTYSTTLSKDKQQDTTITTTKGHPIELITFPSKANNNYLNHLKDDDDEEDLEENISEDVKIHSNDDDNVVDNNDEEEDTTTTTSNVVLLLIDRMDIFIGLLFLGSIAFVGCWLIIKVVPNISSDAPNLTTLIIKLIGWLMLSFLALIPSSPDDESKQRRGGSSNNSGSSNNKNSNDKNENQQKLQRTSMFSISRKIQMLIVYMISWNLFVDIQLEQIHQYNQQPLESYHSGHNKTEIKLSTTDLVHNLSIHNSKLVADHWSDFGSCDLSDDSRFYAPMIGPRHQHVNVTTSSSSSKFISKHCRHRRRNKVLTKKQLSEAEDKSDFVVVEMEMQQRTTTTTTKWWTSWKWRPRNILERLPRIPSFERERTTRSHVMPSQDDHTENTEGKPPPKIIPDFERSSQGNDGSSSTQSDDDASIGRLAENDDDDNNNDNRMADTRIWSDGHNEDHSFTAGTNSLSQSDSPYQMTRSSSESYLQQVSEDSQPPTVYGSYYSHGANQEKNDPYVGNQEYDKVGGQPSVAFSSTLLTGKSMATVASGALSGSLPYDQTVASSSSPAVSAKSFDTTTKVVQEVTLDDALKQHHHVDLNTENTYPSFGNTVNEDTTRNDNDDILSSTIVDGYDVDERDASGLPNDGPVDMHLSHSEALVGRVLNNVYETDVLEERAFVDNDKANVDELLADSRINPMDRFAATPSEHKSALLEGIASNHAADDKLRSSPKLVAVNKNDADTPSSIDEADALHHAQTFEADIQHDTGFEHRGTGRDQSRLSLNVDNNVLPDLKVANYLDGVLSSVDEAETLEDRDFDADETEENRVEPGDLNRKFYDARLKTENDNEFSGNVVIAGAKDGNDEKSLYSSIVSMDMFEEESSVSLYAEETSVPEDSISDATGKDVKKEHDMKPGDIVPLSLIKRATKFMNSIVIGVGEDANDGHSTDLPQVADADAVGALSNIGKPGIFEEQMYDAYAGENPDEYHEVGNRNDLMRLILSESAAHGDDDAHTTFPYEKSLAGETPTRSTLGVAEITQEAAAVEDAFDLTRNGEDKHLQSSEHVDDVLEVEVASIKENYSREFDTATSIPEGGRANGPPPMPRKVVIDVGIIKEKDTVASQLDVVAIDFSEQQRPVEPLIGQRNEAFDFGTGDAYDSQQKDDVALFATEALDTDVRIDTDGTDYTTFEAQDDERTHLEHAEFFDYDSTEFISDGTSTSGHYSPIPSSSPLTTAPVGPSAPILSRAPVAKAALLLSKTTVGKDLLGKVYDDDGALGGYPRISAIDDFNDDNSATSQKVKIVQAKDRFVAVNEDRGHHGSSGTRDPQQSSRLSSNQHDSAPESPAHGRGPRNVLQTVKLKLGLSSDDGVGSWKAVPVSTDTHALFLRHTKNRDYPKGTNRRTRVSASSTPDNTDCSFWKRVSIAVNRRIDAFMGLSVHSDPSCPGAPPRKVSRNRKTCIFSPNCLPISTVGT